VTDRTRAFLKVQDGCDYKCTYCTIPLARGISRVMIKMLKNAYEISQQNIKEIVLGVNIGDYGNLEQKTRTYLLRTSSELDKVKKE
jgi:threonylcarbamoyladenosine tRNA methylthiotransferase MtaB